MGFNFPNTPTVGDLYPTPALPGVPQYRWDGAVWTTTTYDPLTWVQRAGDTMTGALNVVTPPTLPAHAASKAYVDAASVAAAPLNALNYNGIQINGSMEVSQQFPDTIMALSSGGIVYAVDGFASQYSGTGVFVTGQQAPVGGLSAFTKCATITSSTAMTAIGASDSVYLTQTIEGYRVARLAWGGVNAKPITVGFWVLAAIPGTASIAIGNSPANRSYVTNFTINAANTWEYKTVTISGDTIGTWVKDNGIGMRFYFCFAAGSTFQATPNTWVATNSIGTTANTNFFANNGNYIQVTGVTILPGIYTLTSAQSAFMMRPYGEELLICQRYFSRREYLQNVYFVGFKLPGYGFTEVYPFPVTMRAVPTISMPNTTNWNYLNGAGAVVVLTGIGASAVSNREARFGASSIDTDSVPRVYYFSVPGAGYINHDARL